MGYQVFSDTENNRGQWLTINWIFAKKTSIQFSHVGYWILLKALSFTYISSSFSTLDNQFILLLLLPLTFSYFRICILHFYLLCVLAFLSSSWRNRMVRSIILFHRIILSLVQYIFHCFISHLQEQEDSKVLLVHLALQVTINSLEQNLWKEWN